MFYTHHGEFPISYYIGIENVLCNNLTFSSTFTAGNSLQTEIQSLLIEEELNQDLFNHLIPSNFVTQEVIIGQGHFGHVYRGKVFVPELNINKVIAMKALKCEFGIIVTSLWH